MVIRQFGAFFPDSSVRVLTPDRFAGIKKVRVGARFFGAGNRFYLPHVGLARIAPRLGVIGN